MKPLLLLSLTLVLSDMASSDPDPGSKPVKKILAFGGNGFIGSETLHTLFTDPEQYYSVTLVSRGNWYFDSQSRVKPNLHRHIVCDREDSDLEFCTDLIDYFKANPKIDAILDFSAYSPGSVEALLTHIRENGIEVGLYLYISSDSIYEVCRASTTPKLATEEDDKRPEDEEEMNLLIEGDAYGNDKLLGEEVIRRPDNKIPYVIFRLPDVLGPRDTTDRWWTYQLWIQFYKFLKVPLFIPNENRNLRTSFVYVKDVAAAVVLALKNPGTWGGIYNLGMEEPLSLGQFFEKMASTLGVEIATDTGEFNVFPSVSRGAVSIEKAKKVLGFKPSSWDRVMEESTAFYKDAFYKFSSERDDAVHQLTRFVVPRHRKGEFLRLIDEITANPGRNFEEFLANVDTPDQKTEDLTPEKLFQEMMERSDL